ncbi:MAG: AraC family transcriptional regulator [Pseudomonadota bacterium]
MTKRKTNWSKRLEAAIEYIDANIEHSLRLDDVAKAAFCSKFHFHRMFHARLGITCAEYIRQRRLTLAADEIRSSHRSIAEIALKHGYESQNAFTRAFRGFHRINPSVVRANPDSLKPGKKTSLSELGGKIEMDYAIIERPEIKIVGKATRFRFDDFVKDGRKFWKSYVASRDYQNLYRLTAGVPGPLVNAPLMSAYFPDEAGSRDEFIDVLAIEAASDMNLEGFDIHTVPAATYAEFICTYKTSMKTNRYIYGDWFEATGHERDEGKPDIAAYFPIPFKPMSEMTVRWWIPVLPADSSGVAL